MLWTGEESNIRKHPLYLLLVAQTVTICLHLVLLFMFLAKNRCRSGMERTLVCLTHFKKGRRDMSFSTI